MPTDVICCLFRKVRNSLYLAFVGLNLLFSVKLWEYAKVYAPEL
jgi:hypothetical protein